MTARLLPLVLAAAALRGAAQAPAEGGKLLAVWDGHTQEVRSVAFSPDGRRLLSAGKDRRVRYWDAGTGEQLASFPAQSDEIGAALITPDGRFAVAGGEEAALEIWDLSGEEKPRAIKNTADGTRTVALSPDGRLAAAVSFDGALKLFDLRSGKETATLQQGEGAKTMCAAFSPDGKTIFAGEFDYYLRLYDVETRSQLAVWEGHDNPSVTSVAYSPDGRRALTGSRDNTLRYWDMSSRAALAVLRGHASHVLSVAFAPDGKTAVSGGADYTVRKWDLKTGKELSVWRGHRGAVRSVAVSPDATRVASAGDDKTIRLWSMNESEAPGGPAVSRRAPPFALPAGEGTPEERLGRTLFFDPRLSGDNALHCASCHKPEEAYADALALSPGYSDTPYFRNTPGLVNSADLKHLYWDGRFPGEDLNSMIRDHIAESYFMHADGRLIVEKLRQAPGYVRAFREVYGTEPDFGRILDALAAFVRALRSGPSPYDRFLAGEAGALSPEAARGREIFFGKGGCAGCHGGAVFSDEKFHDRRVPPNPAVFQDLMRHVSFRHFARTAGVEGYQELKTDPGLYAATKDKADMGKFRTPSLLQSARTAPYMHNGVFGTLEKVVAHENPKLSAGEVRDVAAFLRSLAGEIPVYAPPPLPEYGLLGSTAAGPALREVPARTTDPSRVPRTLAGVYRGFAMDRSSAPNNAAIPQSAGTGPADVPFTPAKFPPLAPLPPVPVPPDNPQTPAKIRLGTILFCEPLLTGNGDNYCSHCHMPFMGWGDGSDVSQGHNGTLHWRNAQSLFNAAYFTKLDWDGSALSLEDQARSALLSGMSGNAEPALLEERLAMLPEYVDLFKEAFGVDRPTFEGILKALAAFERDVPISRNVPFDNYMRGDKKALSPAALRGFALFNGKAACIRCHNGALASDQGFHATGVPENPEFKDVPLRQIALRYAHVVRGVPEEAYRQARTDPGLYLSTLREEDRGKFRTPSLRELKHTAPYMHNGVFASLEKVLDFYDKGAGETPNKSPLLQKLSLTAAEKKDLIAFLESLSMDKMDPLRIQMR